MLRAGRSAAAQRAHLRRLTTRAPSPPSVVEIGGVTDTVRTPSAPWLVPSGYIGSQTESSQAILKNLRWMLQKSSLAQDMFLIGAPGPERRWLAMAFCELTQREVEFVALSRDTTETDLKQRREITQRSAIFEDQAPVRAALQGRVLVLDGIEKAERNVLPVLNNLLENREMALEDGRFIVSAERWAALLREGNTDAELEAKQLVRAHEDFRVIALGVPVPPYEGRLLDPPLRSRFQALHVPSLGAGELLDLLADVAPNLEAAAAQQLAAASEALHAVEGDASLLGLGSAGGGSSGGGGGGGGAGGDRLRHFPASGLPHIAKVAEKFPQQTMASLMDRLFPFSGSLGDARAAEAVRTALGADGGAAGTYGATGASYELQSVTRCETAGEGETDVQRVDLSFAVRDGVGDSVDISAAAGLHPPSCNAAHDAAQYNYIATESQQRTLSEALQDHALNRDILLVGSAGSGKSVLAQAFARRLGYSTEHFPLYRDMTARDLLQRRSTSADGNSTWAHSPLVEAAVTGRLAILDGVDRLPSDTLATLQRLAQDREVTLPNGVTLIPPGRPIPEGAEGAEGVLRVHPAFRIVALATHEGRASGKKGKWLSDEVLAMFSTHVMPRLSEREHELLLAGLPSCAALPEPAREALLKFNALVEFGHWDGGAGGAEAHSSSAASSSQVKALSTRQLLRVARKMVSAAERDEGGAGLRAGAEALKAMQMFDFLATDAQEEMTSLLSAAGFPGPGAQNTKRGKGKRKGKNAQHAQDGALSITHTPVEGGSSGDSVLSIGDVTYMSARPKRPELVPSPRFVDIKQHIVTLQRMLADLTSGGERHLLLMGNQGVGKNKLADRLLQLMRCEREYIQLHRDSTVAALTLVPTLVDGLIKWEDSPLVKAVIHGRVLVVDEADKAPVEVVSILKSLVEDGDMLLADGRRLLDPQRAAAMKELDGDDSSVVAIHPDFKLWVLANRPGFPFMGNDFFREAGDVFSPHIIANPDTASELELLSAYAPGVPNSLLQCLAGAFGELRALVEDGQLSYPYSTREAVAVVSHLEVFPDDGLVGALENVLAFDAYSPDLRRILSEVFNRHGIPLPAFAPTEETTTYEVRLATEKSLPEGVATASWEQPRDPWDDGDGGGGHGGASSGGSAPSSGGRGAFGGSTALPLQSMVVDVDVDEYKLGAAKVGGTFAPDSSRLSLFTEERDSFRVPVEFRRRERGSPACTAAIATADAHAKRESLHVLSTRPLQLHNYEFDVAKGGAAGSTGNGGGAAAGDVASSAVGQYSRHDIYNMLPWGGELRVTGEPEIAAFGGPGKPSIALLLPRMRLVGRLWPSTGRVHMTQLAHVSTPTLEGSGDEGETTGLLSSLGLGSRGSAGAGRGGGSGKDLRLGGVVCTPEDDDVHGPSVVLFEEGGSLIRLVDIEGATERHVFLPAELQIERIETPSTEAWVVAARTAETAEHDETPLFWLTWQDGIPASLEPINETQTRSGAATFTPAGASRFVSAPAKSGGSTAFSAPHLPAEFTSAVRHSDAAAYEIAIGMPPSVDGAPVQLTSTPRLSEPAWPEETQIAAAMALTKQLALVRGQHVEVFSPERGTVRAFGMASYDSAAPVAGASARAAVMARCVDGDDVIGAVELPLSGELATVQAAGRVRRWQTDPETLAEELSLWGKMVGMATGRGAGAEGGAIDELGLKRLSIKRDAADAASAPRTKVGEAKHGKHDPTGDPHVGGNTWAGGTGGSDTAGLGGRGGPYRLDLGHNVHQVSDADKAAVSKEAAERARAMGQEALAARLREIDMNEDENDTYSFYRDRVAREIATLRATLEGVESKRKERTWLRHQSFGELDDSKLVDGMIGERLVFKRRGRADDASDDTPTKRRMRFVMDCSGSMYRFNGMDGRLDRVIETAALLMEGLSGLEQRFEYTIEGHSGDGPQVQLLDSWPPANRKERLAVMERMAAHSQFCMSGDYTVEAVEMALADAHRASAGPDAVDEEYIFLVSDANLRRYGISPSHISRLMQPREGIAGVFAIFIASLGDEAEQLQKALPPGRGFVCLDTAEVPALFRQVLTRVQQADDN